VLDLSTAAGFPVLLHDDGRLTFRDGFQVETTARYARDLTAVARDGRSVGQSLRYTMYRHLPVHDLHGVRYDLTVLANVRSEGEFAKTFGHVHPADPRTGCAHNEVYSLVHGRALWLLFLVHGDLDDAYAVVAEPGDALVIPPQYAHATINIGGSPLVMANLVSDAFAPDYEPVRRRRGAPWYVVEGPGGRPELVCNPTYPTAPPPPVMAAPRYGVLGLDGTRTLVEAVGASRSAYSFLERAEPLPSEFALR
jgi:glucose-6-phosphate isomerase, archaeal